ncbi:acyl-CoA dehydrogenase family protein [Actinokineospora enzanensis]|uniref:acyl-CoA dehydrogenase family protein n=1 Tax=Actinokineospora enzanensis TaxID=155975 RepID=UPI00035CF814|nr:acyl-CoA dehydrogenase family protein [Actinokineospora enzanensis]
MTGTLVSNEPRTGAEILARARALAPVLRARAAEIEQAGRLPADVVDLLRDAGVFRMCFGPEWGGPGMTSTEQTEVVEALAYGDASAGWCAMIGANTGIYSAFLEPAVAREMFPHPDMITAGLLQPAGKAEKVSGGYRLSGRWTFGSGITHADWVTSGAFIYQNGEPYASPDGSNPHESRQFLVRRDQVEVIDNWDPVGLRGSGSCDYVITDVFVPEEHTLSFDRVLGTPGPLAQPDAFTRSMCGVPLGVARAALDHAREVILDKVDRMTGTAWADTFRVQLTLAKCEAAYNAARHGVYESMNRQWEVLSSGGTFDDLTPDERAACPLSWVHAFRSARTIVNTLFDLLQTASIHRSAPMERWLRDTTTMVQHLAAQDRILQSAGAYLLGAKPEFGICLGIL